MPDGLGFVQAAVYRHAVAAAAGRAGDRQPGRAAAGQHAQRQIHVRDHVAAEGAFGLEFARRGLRMQRGQQLGEFGIAGRPDHRQRALTRRRQDEFGSEDLRDDALDAQQFGDRGRQDQAVDLAAPQVRLHGAVHTAAEDAEFELGPVALQLIAGPAGRARRPSSRRPARP